MHWLSCAALLALAELGRCSGQQLPLQPVLSSNNAAHSSRAPEYRSDLLSLHKALVSTPSTSGQEEDIAQVLRRHLLEYGWEVAFQPVPPRDNTPEGSDRFNVVAWPSSDRTSPKVMLTSHIDAVPPHIPYKIEEGEITKSTRISGRGSVDAKASVAAMIVAVDELLNGGKVERDEIMLLFVVGEEVSGDGMRVFSDSLQSADGVPQLDAAIFGEPTEGKLACGHKGGLQCRITAQGVGGHSGYPWLGKSANELLVRAMAQLFDADLGSSEDYGNTTVNLGLVQGGVAYNVIPEHAFAGLMVRVAVGPEAGGGEIVRQRIKKIIDQVDEEALDLECDPSYGFVSANCDVDGTNPSFCKLVPDSC